MMVRLVANAWSDNLTDGFFFHPSLRLLVPLNAATRTIEDQTESFEEKKIPEKFPEAGTIFSSIGAPSAPIPRDPASSLFPRE